MINFFQIEKEYTWSVFETGYDIAKDKWIAIVGMSIGNSYFKAEAINNLVEFAESNFKKTYFFMPYEPTVHTFKAIGYNQTKAERKARLGSNALANHTIKAIDSRDNLIIVDWFNDVNSQEVYKKSLKHIYSLYSNSSDFKKDADETTKRVLEGKIKEWINIDDWVEIWVNYLLEELAFLLVSPRLFDALEIVYIYHRRFEIFEKLINWKYDGNKKKNIWFLIVS